MRIKQIKLSQLFICMYCTLLMSGCQLLPFLSSETQNNPLGNVDWTRVITATGLGCDGPWGHLGVQIDEKQFADITGDGKAEAFIAAACAGSTSSWPDRLEAFNGASNPAHPQLLAILLNYQDGTDERGLRIGKNFGISQSVKISGRTVTVVSVGYDFNDGNCCLSQRITDIFTWYGSGFNRGQRSIISTLKT